MKHPFEKVLPVETDDSPAEHSRRDAIRSAVQVGAGVLVSGLAANLAVAQEIGVGPAILPPGESALVNHICQLHKVEEHMERSDWEKAASCFKELDKLSKPQGEGAQFAEHRANLKKTDQLLKKKILEALGKADRQAKSGKLVPALRTFRMVQRIGDRYGFKQRAEKSIVKLAKADGYQEALRKVKLLENPPELKETSAARGEEGGGPPFKSTTLRIGEEGGGKREIKPPVRLSTRAVGEEGGRLPSTDAAGEEG